MAVIMAGMLKGQFTQKSYFLTYHQCYMQIVLALIQGCSNGVSVLGPNLLGSLIPLKIKLK